MIELAMVLVSFVTIPLFKKTKLGIGPTLIATALVMAALNRLPLGEVWEIFLNVFKTPNSLETVLVVAMVSIIGAMMKEYKVLEKVVEALSELVRSQRVLFIILPALVGTLTIPGGAILSAPFVDSMGNKVNMPPPKRAAVNLLFRHIAMFLLPYSSSLLVVNAILPQFKIPQIIAVNAVFTIPMVLAGYFLYLRGVPAVNERPPELNIGRSLKNVLLYASPIYICIIINILTGFPLFVCMFASLVILYFLGTKKGFFALIFKSINYNTMLAVIGVFMIQGIVNNLEGLIGIFQAMFNSGTFMLPAIVLGCIFFGSITGFHMVPMGIVFPMLLGIGLDGGELLAYVYLIYCWSFLGYYFSPLHMCQIFTCEYMKVKQGELMKEYIPLLIFDSVYIIASFFALKAILPMIFG